MVSAGGLTLFSFNMVTVEDRTTGKPAVAGTTLARLRREIREKKKREPQMNTDKHGYSKGCKVIRHAIVPQAVRGGY